MSDRQFRRERFESVVYDNVVRVRPGDGAGEGQVDKITASVMAVNNYPLSVDASRPQRVADVMLQFGPLRRPFSIQSPLN